MKVLYYDCFSGISGDMNLGALVDLGVNEEFLINELKKLGLSHAYNIVVQKVVKHGITGTKVDVIQTLHEHAHRGLGDIQKIIEESTLGEKVKQRSIAMFTKIAHAEAKVHGMPLEQVHFHEVGAIDSIVDVVGAAICIEALAVDKIVSSSIELGSGFVKCAHGVLPVPAPATIEILKNLPIKIGGAPFEATTPTGAAILATNATFFTNSPKMSIEKIGYGFGTATSSKPNALRVFLGEEEVSIHAEKQCMLETNIDDMNPEILAYCAELLFEKGALDVYRTPIVMKKGRMGTKLSVLYAKSHEAVILETIFKETTSIGVRKYDVEKIMLERKESLVETKYGAVKLKVTKLQDGSSKHKAEFEDCKKLALSHGVTLKSIYEEVERNIHEH